MALTDLTQTEINALRRLAHDQWAGDEPDQIAMPQSEPIQQCDGGYWVPALLFVSDEQVERRSRES